MANSTHKVEVTPIKLEPHPNADTLSIAHIFDGYICVVKTTDWQDGQLGAYIPPDSIVDSSRPEFAFLQGHERIRVKRLRGVVSSRFDGAPDACSCGGTGRGGPRSILWGYSL